jgi:hypothetical protein
MPIFEIARKQVSLEFLELVAISDVDLLNEWQ